jgi:hypothetical protein
MTRKPGLFDADARLRDHIPRVESPTSTLREFPAGCVRRDGLYFGDQGLDLEGERAGSVKR